MISFKSIGDERLDFALERVQEVIQLAEPGYSEEERRLTSIGRKTLGKQSPKEVAKNYHQYIKSFGMLMLNSGLVGALLFAQGKANKEDEKAQAYGLIIRHLTGWLHQRSYVAQTGKSAIQSLSGNNSLHILQATREALAFLQDLKRVADARFQKPEKK